MSDSDEGDVEPDDIAPSAATHPVSVPPSSHEIVRSQVEAVRGPESMPTGPVPVRATLSPEETPFSGGGPSIAESVGPLLAGILLGCPGSHADLTTVTGQMSFPPTMDRRKPLQSPHPHAQRATAAAGDATGKAKGTTQQPPARPPYATAAAEDLTLSQQRGRPPTSPTARCRSTSAWPSSSRRSLSKPVNTS